MHEERTVREGKKKAKDSDVKVRRWRIKEEEEKRYDSWQEGRWKRKRGPDTECVLTSRRPSLSSLWLHH